MYFNLRIVLINWNLKDDTLQCLESLFQAGISPSQVLLIDNGSTDGSVTAFKTHFGSQLQIIQNECNLGYVNALNQGVYLALEQGAEWILLLNNDTWVDREFFTVFDEFIKTDPPYSILAPLIYYAAQPHLVWNLGDQLIKGTLLTTRPYQNKPLPGGLPSVIPVDFVTGCAMLVHRQVFERIGLFDRGLEMYSEEVDFCQRARIAGFHLACLPKARMWHKVSASAKMVSPKTSYLRTRNQVYFYRRYSSGAPRLLMWLFSTSKTLLRSLALRLHKQSELSRSIQRGWLDGWLKPLPAPDIPYYGNHLV